jgi:2-aminoethylphosphonate transport system substrate-binding protein
MLAQKQQQEVSSIGGGFSARQDIKATDANAVALTRIMGGVDFFEPDWTDIDKNLTTYVEDWKSATGS